MPDPDPPSAGDARADPAPSVEAQGSRPTQLTADRVAAFLDQHEAKTGFPCESCRKCR